MCGLPHVPNRADFAPTMGCGATPRKLAEGGRRLAGDQTNAMVATSKEVIPRPRKDTAFSGHKRPQTALALRCGILPAMLGNLPHIASFGLDRVNRVERWGTLVTVTFGTAQLDQPLSVAPPHHAEDTDFA